MIIGIFTDTYLPDVNGVATASRILKDTLEEKGHTVIIVTTGTKGQKRVSYEKGILRIPGKSLRSLYDYRLCFIFNKKAFKILKKIHFDVIHIQQEFGVSIFGRILAKVLNIPVVYTYHTAYENYTDYLPSIPNTRKMIISLIKHVILLNGEVTTPSSKTRKALHGFGIRKSITIIPTPCETAKPYTHDKEREENFRLQHNLIGKKIILFLGRLAPEKNVEEIMKGYDMYCKTYGGNNTVLLIVGGGPDKERLEQIKDSLDSKKNIIFTGKVEHDYTTFYYSISSCFVSASTTETQGLTYSEAIEQNLPILAKFDFNLEYLIEDGVTGFFYDTIDSLPDALENILNKDTDDIEKITSNAKVRSNYLFSKEKYYERIYDIYEKAIRQSF